MKQRYSMTGSYETLLLSLQRGMQEFSRVLKPKGFVLLEMMDLTEGRRRRWSHIDIANLWAPGAKAGRSFRENRAAIDGLTQVSQQRSRSSHTYFMGFSPLTDISQIK